MFRSETEYYVAKVEWPVDEQSQQSIKNLLFEYEHPKLAGATLDLESKKRYLPFSLRKLF